MSGAEETPPPADPGRGSRPGGVGSEPIGHRAGIRRAAVRCEYITFTALAVGTTAYLAILSPWFFTSRPVADVGIAVGGAARMLAGQVPYKDFFLFIGPLTPAATAAWFLAMGHGAASMIALTILLGTSTALATYWMARSVTGPALAAVAAIGAMAFGFTFWFTISHHWYSTLFLVLGTGAAARAVAGSSWRWLAFAALLCAIGTLAHQSRGALELVVLLMVAAVAWPRGRRREAVASVLVGAGVPLGATALLLAWAAGPFELVYSLVTFVVQQYPQANSVPYLAFDLVPPGFLLFPDLAVLTAGCAYLAAAAGPLGPFILAGGPLLRPDGSRPMAWKPGSANPRLRQADWVLGAMGLGAYVGVLYHPSAVHLGYASPWFAASCCVLLRRLLGASGALARRVGPLLTVGLCASLVIFLPLPQARALLTGSIKVAASPTGPVPLGTVQDADLFSGSFETVQTFLTEHTRPGDPVIFYPYRTVNNVILDRPNPTRLDLLQEPENAPAQIDEFLRQVVQERRARYVIIEKVPAANMATRPRAEGDSFSLTVLRSMLPLVMETATVEIRTAGSR